MKTSLRPAFLGIALVLNAVSAWAGTESSGGGGDIVVCQQAGASGDRAYLADIFPLRKHSAFLFWNQLSEDAVISTFLNRLADENPTYATKLQASLNSLKFVDAGELPELDDDGLELPAGCREVQLAIQELASGTVYVNSALLAILSPAQRGLFRIHEAHIRLQVPGQITDELRSYIGHLALGHLPLGDTDAFRL